MELKLQARQVPQQPGVYFFSPPADRQGAKGKILYIGKAANLRARLNSYLREIRLFDSSRTSLKLSSMLAEAKFLSWEILGSEAEALIKEAEYIKKYHPKYNVLMRDDKQYFYVGFTREKFPRIFITHQPKTNNYKLSTTNYIGPFTEGGTLRSVLKTLRRAFPYCTCKKPHKGLCLNARIGRCIGFCCTKDQRKLMQSLGEVYKKNISAIKKILSGKNKLLAKTLKIEMHKLSEVKKYEEAGKIRDQIRALEKIFAHQSIIKKDTIVESQKASRYLESLLKIKEIRRIEAYDVSNIHGRFAYGSMVVFLDGKPQKSDYRIFKINTVRGANDPAMLREIIFRRLKHKEWPYPEVIVVDGGKAQLSSVLNAIPYALNAKVVALTKDNKHRGDHILLSGKKDPLSLKNLPESLKNLILHLDSEAHRFAIKHYRKLHRKAGY